MTRKELAHHLFQTVYYGNIDSGDMDGAATALHPDIVWSHAQVWAHHEFARGEAKVLHGRKAVHDYLAARVPQLREAAITHHVREMVMEGDTGAFIGAVEGPGPEKQFMVWFTLKDDLIGTYTLRPL